MKALAIDAPLVAVLWTELLRREFTTSITPTAQHTPLQVDVVVFAVVWLVYMLDRWLDCRILDYTKPVSDRHRFVRRHRHRLKPLWCVAAMLTTVFACFTLDRWLIAFGIAHLSIVGLYFTAIHRQRLAGQWVPKEVVVGWTFAMGTALAACPSQPSLSIVPSDHHSTLGTMETWGTFAIIVGWVGALFVFNCMIVANQQFAVDRAQGTPSVVGRNPWLRTHLSHIGLVCTGFVLIIPLVVPISRLLWMSILSSFAISTWLCVHSNQKESAGSMDVTESAESLTRARVHFADVALIMVPLAILSVQGLLTSWEVSAHVR